MKKISIFVIVAVLIVEIILLIQIRKNNSKDKNSVATEGDESGFKVQLSTALQQVESLKKKSESLKISADEAVRALQAKEKELLDARKAIETLQAGVTVKFDEYQKKATEFDNKRKADIAEINKKIETLNSEKAALGAKLDEELKKRDAVIEQLNKSVQLSDKVLGEERQQTAALTKQLNEEQGKVKALTDQITAATAEKEGIKKQLEDEKQKNAALTAENEALKKKVDEMTKKP